MSSSPQPPSYDEAVNSDSTVDGSCYVIILAVVFLVLLTSVLCFSCIFVEAHVPEPSPTLTYASDTPNVVIDSFLIKNAYANPSRQFSPDWFLPQDDSGGIAFQCCAPQGGLILYLVDVPNTVSLGDSRGYAVIFDNQRDPAETYVAPVPGVPSKHPKSRVNRGFRLNAAAPSTCQQYWVVYKQGNVIVGQGALPHEQGESRVITCMLNDTAPPTDIRFFGFGALRATDELGIRLENLYTFDAPADDTFWNAASPVCVSSATCGTLE